MRRSSREPEAGAAKKSRYTEEQISYALSCGVESLGRYLKTQASQDVRRKANAVFVMTTIDAPDGILGYFTLCATALEQGDVPEAARKYVPRSAG